MISKKDLELISHLRRNARVKLTKVSKETCIPVSTIFDKMKNFEGNLFQRHVTLIDFTTLGFNARANICLKIDKKDKENILEYLKNHQNVNSMFKINNGFDIMIEVIFKNIREMEDFIENIENKYHIKQKQVYYLIDDILRESFLSRPEYNELI